MTVYWSEDDLPEESIINDMERAADLCVRKEGLDPEKCRVSVSFVEEEEIRALNKEFRGKDEVTDVLSFPQYEPEDLDTDMPLLLGDVVICRARAREQAEEYGHSFRRETVYLFVHSMFHLLGYDHMEDEEKKIMRSAEEEVLELLEIGRE